MWDSWWCRSMGGRYCHQWVSKDLGGSLLWVFKCSTKYAPEIFVGFQHQQRKLKICKTFCHSNLFNEIVFCSSPFFSFCLRPITILFATLRVATIQGRGCPPEIYLFLKWWFFNFGLHSAIWAGEVVQGANDSQPPNGVKFFTAKWDRRKKSSPWFQKFESP